MPEELLSRLNNLSAIIAGEELHLPVKAGHCPDKFLEVFPAVFYQYIVSIY